MEELAGTFVGSWDVLEATLPNGQFGYSGTINVKRNGAAFDLDWEITAGRYVGIGLPINSHLFVSCAEQRAGLGIALFRVQPDSRVSILWCTPELEGAVGSGEFTSDFYGSFDGEHQLRQHLPDGSIHGEWTVADSEDGQPI